VLAQSLGGLAGLADPGGGLVGAEASGDSDDEADLKDRRPAVATGANGDGDEVEEGEAGHGQALHDRKQKRNIQSIAVESTPLAVIEITDNLPAVAVEDRSGGEAL
jgi:hypothetical protein